MRVQHKPILIDESGAQLWVAQTLRLVRAYQTRGTFLDPVVEDIRPDMMRWERDNQAHLRKLAVIISKILVVMKEEVRSASAVLTYEANGDKLVIQTTARERMLPRDLYSKWAESGVAGVDEHTAPSTPDSRARIECRQAVGSMFPVG